MAEIRTGQYNFGQINTPKMADMTQIYASVGQRLNKMYYDNRQAYVNNIVNPLSQMRANPDDEQLLNDKRNAITDGANEFKENDNWHQASDYIYDTVENIVSDEALDLINIKYQQRQAYIQELKDSGWDAENQSIFLARSDYYSEAVQEENGRVVAGSFNAVQHGTPFDLKEEFDRITNLAAKVKADGYEISSISAENAVISELANILNIDGETFVSNFLKTVKSAESISRDKIFKFAYAQLANNPEFINYGRIIGANELFKARWIPDNNNPRGGTLRDLSPELLRDVFSQSYVLTSLNGMGIALSDLGSLNEDGTFTINKNMSKDTMDKLTAISSAVGYDMVSLLTKGSISNEYGDVDSLDDLLNITFNSYIDSLFNDYLKNKNISESDPNIDIYKENWYTNMYSNNFIQSTINGTADSIADLISYNKVKTTYDLISNGSVYSAAYKARADKIKRYAETNPPTVNTLPDVQVSTDSTTALQDRKRELEDIITRCTNEILNIPITSNIYNVLGKLYGIDKGDTKALLELDFTDIINNPNIELTDSERESLQRIYRNNMIIQQAQSEIDTNNLEIEKTYDILLDDGISNYDTESQDVLRNRITNYDDYVEYRENYPISASPVNYIYPGNEIPAIRHDFADRNYRMLTESEFDDLQKSLADKAAKIYEKNTGESLKYTSKGVVINNPSTFTQQYVDNAIAALSVNADGWTLESVNGSKKFRKDIGLSLANNEEFVKLATTNAPRSSSGTIPSIDKVGISKKETGFSDDIYDVEVRPVYDNLGLIEGDTAKQKLMLIFRDKNGAVIGNSTISRNITKEAYLDMIQHDYNAIRNAQIYDNNIVGESVLEESRGKLASQAAGSMFTFRSVPNTGKTATAATTTNLQMIADNLSVGTGINGAGEKMYVQTDLIIPGTQQIIAKPYFEISKVSLGSNGYGFNVRMVQPDANGNWVDASYLDWGNEDLNTNFYTLSNRALPVKNINDAFRELSDYLLDLGFKFNNYYGE